ncbi:cell wall integrity/stress response component protein [Trifolium repens]|nr:cell wall integrity/stress response component protein [Trifolium repens]
MAPLLYFGRTKLLLLSLLFFLSLSIVSFTATSESQLNTKQLTNPTRTMLEFEVEKNKSSSTKNQTKLIKLPNNNLSSKNQTKTIKSNTNNNLISKNQTKSSKPTNNKTTFTDNTTSLKKLNSTTFKTKKLNSTSKSSSSNNSTKSTSKSISLDLVKKTSGGGSGTKNKTTKSTATKTEQQNSEKPKQSNKKQTQPSNWFFDEEDTDFVSEFKDLPIKFQQTLLPDLEKISTTSKAYITKANKEITKNFKPYVGNKYAPTIATLLSCACVLIPLLLASLLFNQIKAYFSLQKLLIFIQAYLSIYFSILCFSSLITGLEPLRFFYSTSQSTYLILQVIQTLAYFLYLLLLVMYLLLVFSTDCGLGSKLLGLAQTFVGFAVGLHYYMTVFHKVVLRQPPKTNWKIHGIYATCFVLICVLATAERRKKTYLEEGGEEGKKN